MFQKVLTTIFLLQFKAVSMAIEQSSLVVYKLTYQVKNIQ